MGTVARDAGKTFTPAPEGTFSAVCVDVVDLGLVETPYGAKDKITVVWEIDEDHPDFDGRYTVNKRYTLSLNEKATLCKDLEAWRGKRFTDDEKKGFDVEKLIGAPCMVSVQHNRTGDKTYANVVAITPLPKGLPRLSPSGDYTRVKDKPGGWDVRSPQEESASGSGGDGHAAPFMPDDNLPF